MVITQRVTSLAYSLQDNLTGKASSSKCTSNSVDRELSKLEKIPSPLEYFAFTLAFQTLMCGPVVFYSDYIKFIEGARVDEVIVLLIIAISLKFIHHLPFFVLNTTKIM